MQKKRTEPYLATYLHGRGGKLGMPVSGNFELTARCNFRCPMCYVHLTPEEVERQGRELTAEQWIGLARQAADRGMVFALLTGGEPFLRPDFFEIYHAMKAMGLMLSINSNGSMIQGEILERLKEDPPFRVNISLYGGSRETYRRMCGNDAFDQVIANIRALKEAGIDVQINVSITPYNRDDLEQVWNLAQELGVPARASSYMYPPIRVHEGQYGCGARLTAEEAAQCTVEWDLLRFSEEEFVRRAENMHAMEGVEMGDCQADPDEGVSCRAGHSSFWLTWDGKLRPCGMMPYPEREPLEIGFGAAWDQIREETLRIRMPRECGVCPKREVCFVCAAVCITETGAFDQVPAYVCRQTDATIETTWSCYQSGGHKSHDPGQVRHNES